MLYRHKKRRYRALIAYLAALSIWIIAGTALAEDVKTAEPEKLVYKQTVDSKGEAVELNLHVFKPEGWSAEDARPAIVFFFGGGWVGGRPQQFYPHCRDLASMGMVAISAEYRIKRKHGTSPLACVEDGKSAVRFLRANSEQLGIDPGRIASGGGSAGGHVAACTGVIKGFDADGEDASISSVPNLMVLFNPVIDTSPKTGYGANKVPGDDPLIISPLHHVHRDQPPSIIFHGDADTTVKIDSVRRFWKRSMAIGAGCTLHEYKGAGHGFFNHSGFKKQEPGTPDYYAKTMDELSSYLIKHDYISAEAGN